MLDAFIHQKETIYPSWQDDPVRVAARRIKELRVSESAEIEFGGKTYVVKRTDFRRLHVHHDDRLVFTVNTGHKDWVAGKAASEVIKWIEEQTGIAKGQEIMALSKPAAEFLRKLVMAENGIARTSISGKGSTQLIAGLKSKDLIDDKDEVVVITKHGLKALYAQNGQKENKPRSRANQRVMYGHTPQPTDVPSTLLGTAGVMAADVADRLADESPAADVPADDFDRLSEIDSVVLKPPAAEPLADCIHLVRTQIDGANVVILLEVDYDLLVEMYPLLAQLMQGFKAVGIEVMARGQLTVKVGSWNTMDVSS